MSQSVRGKTAIVTGSGSGINLAFATMLLEKGCNVVFADISLRPEAKQVLAAYSQAKTTSGRAVFQETDVREWKQLERMFDTAEREFGDVDIVCPGAGVYEPTFSNFWYPPGSTKSKDPADGNSYAIFDINLVHPVRTSQIAISKFLNSTKPGPKTIIIISSTSAQDTSFATPLYDASKHAISGFVRAIKDVDELGIRVAAVAPGIIKTPLYIENPEKLAMISDSKDTWVEPEEVAEVMVNLIERDTMSHEIGNFLPEHQDITVSSGLILEVIKGRVRPVTAFNDPGPSGPGALASNMAASENACKALLKKGWGSC
ncbi:hypothetical protein FQN57_001469 [Myotisia sp. PD_48]|nr:hypothetical protein FQN57_001469 [Myotisia sp. PD_48]